MRSIKVLTDEDFGLKSIPFNNPRKRLGARGIIFNDNGQIAILNKSLKNEYKLIGGGIEENENPAEAFKRETLEESGCVIEIDDCLGIIKEEKSQDNFMQISYVYVAHVIENTGHTNFTQEELDEGANLLWLNLDEAIELIENSENKLVASKHQSIYHTKFIVRRDTTILKFYKSLKEHN